jgi:hypothetical protein
MVVLNGRYRDRTCDPLIKSQPREKRKFFEHEDIIDSDDFVLSQNLAQILEKYPELAGIIEAWPEISRESREAVIRIINLK